MATWKKVIVSGSDAALNQLNVSSNQQITSLSSTTFLTGSFTGSFTGDGSGLTGLVSTLSVTGSTGSGSVNLLTQGLTITGTANEVETSVSGQTVTIGLPNDITLSGDLTIAGDKTVAGTASFQNQTSLVIADRFILLASGSTSLTDGGFIINSGGNTGSAFYLESTSTGTYGRFAVAGDANASASVLTANEFAVTAKQDAGVPSGNPTWGGPTNGFGNIYVDSSTGDIYIYS